jgi:hypothetical protein
MELLGVIPENPAEMCDKVTWDQSQSVANDLLNLLTLSETTALEAHESLKTQPERRVLSRYACQGIH